MNTQYAFQNQLWKTSVALRRTGACMLLLWLAALPGTAQIYTVLHSFGSTDLGCNPNGGLVQGPDGMLYGTTTWGGVPDRGTVFTLNTDGSGYAVLYSFEGGLDGDYPMATLVMSGTTLYGTTPDTGYNSGGALFKLDVRDCDFTVLRHYNNSGGEGIIPMGGVVLSGTTLYGTTEYNEATAGGGALGAGTIFKVNTDGSGYTVLWNFSGSDGMHPTATLMLDGKTLFGTTRGLGTAGNFGTVFKINTDGTGFTVLKSFEGTNGNQCCGSLMLSGTTLYGTTLQGGDVPGGGSGNGTVFKLNTDGSGFSLLKSFYGNDGAWLNAGLVLSGTTLYGTTIYTTNWVDGYGTVFSINTDGTGFKVIKAFNGADGANPQAGLLLAGETLYGTTSSGGPGGGGVLFSVELAPPTMLTSPTTGTAEAGSTFQFGVTADGSMPLWFEWFFDATNAIGDATTNCTLELANVRSSQAGSYTVVVSNLFGVVTSTPAILGVIAPVPRRIVPAINLTGEVGSTLNLECTAALGPGQTWLPLGAASLTSISQFYFDLSEPLRPRQFYRAWRTGPASTTPWLSLNMVPAITLTGTVGSSLRLDYINVYGPLDAWVPVATVTLTNTTQLYFDVSSIGQPARLWRIVPLP